MQIFLLLLFVLNSVECGVVLVNSLVQSSVGQWIAVQRSVAQRSVASVAWCF